MEPLTHEELGAAIVGLLLITGLAGLGMTGLLKKLGFLKSNTGECHHINSMKPVCVQGQAAMTERLITLENGQEVVKTSLDLKRVKIEKLQADTTEIKTDVKWIVRAIREKNDI